MLEFIDAVRHTWPFAAYLFIDQKKGFGHALWIDTAGQWKPGSSTAECVGSL